MIQAQRATDSILLVPGAAATATQGANLDCKTANYATIRLALGTAANTNASAVTISVKNSDDTVVTNFATIATDITQSLSTSVGKVVDYHVNMAGKKRYLRLVVTPGTVATTDAVAIAAIGTLGRKKLEPASTSDNADSCVIVI